MSSDSNQNHSRRASYVVRETPVPLPSYAGAHQGQTWSSPSSASGQRPRRQPQQSSPTNGRSHQDSVAVEPPLEPTENSNPMSSSGRQLRSRRAAPSGPPPAQEPPSKKRKATSGAQAAAVEPPQEQPAQPVLPPLPHQDGESQGQEPQPSKEMSIIGPPLQPGADALPPNNNHNNDADEEIYRVPPLPPYLHEPPRICEPAANYRGWSTPLEFSYKMPVHPLTFYGSFDIWFEQVQKIAEACHCAAELNTRIGTFPNPGTVEAFICQTRFLSCWRILHGTISGSYWAYMRVLGYSRIPVFMGAPDGDPEEERGGGGNGGWSQCQWQPQPSDCVYFALEVKKRAMVPSSDNQPRYQTMRMVEEVRSAKPSDYPSLQQYREGIQWLKEVLNGFIMKGDRQVCESLYGRKPDWAPEWTDVPQRDGEIEPPWALKGHPIRVEEAFATPVAASTGGPNGKAEHHQYQQHQPHPYHIDPQLHGPSNNHGHNNHAIARLAPMSVSGASSSDSGSGDYNNNYVPDGLPPVDHHYPNNNSHSHSHNLVFQDGTSSGAAAVAAAEAHGLGSASSGVVVVGGGGADPTTRSHGQHQHNLFN